jgi:hypothetical protein
LLTHQFQNADENTAPKVEKKPKVNGDVQPNQEESAEEHTGEQPAEDEPAKLTLAEYRAQQKQEKVTFNSRQVEHDDKALKNFEAIKREDNQKEEGEEYEEVQSKRQRK